MPIYDNYGLPRDIGATDWMDSSRLAGMMVLFGHYNIPISRYFDYYKKIYLRYPYEPNPYDFSRDQALCLVAGLWNKEHYDIVHKKFVTGRDIFTPSHMGHFKRCANKKPNLLQKAWLWLDVLYSTHLKPLSEPNQIIAMMYVAYLQDDKSYLKYWLKNNKDWKKSITFYWCGWRSEPELANRMISVLESCND